jgi:hypothetical protein
MNKALLLALALAVIPVAVDAQNPLADYWRARAEAGQAIAQYNLGVLYSDGEGELEDDAEERLTGLASSSP